MLTRVWVGGTRAFNNYWLAYTYLNDILAETSIILSGGARGADELGEMYGRLNGHPVEVYPANWDKYGKAAGMRRNAEVVKYATSAIFFWDNISKGTAHSIELCRKRGIKPIIIDVTEDDYIKQHKDIVKQVNRDEFDIFIGRGKTSIWGNPYPIRENYTRYQAIYLFTDYLLKNKELLSQVLSLKDKTLGCHCAPDLCHGDVLAWLCEHPGEIKTRLNELSGNNSEGPEDKKNTHKPWELDVSNWDKNGGRVLLHTSTGLHVANGYKRLIREKNIPYLEIKDPDIIKSNLHIPLKEQQGEKPLSERISIFYVSNDRTNTKLRYQQVEFDGCEFKQGYWYLFPKDIIQK